MTKFIEDNGLISYMAIQTVEFRGKILRFYNEPATPKFKFNQFMFNVSDLADIMNIGINVVAPDGSEYINAVETKKTAVERDRVFLAFFENTFPAPQET